MFSCSAGATGPSVFPIRGLLLLIDLDTLIGLGPKCRTLEHWVSRLKAIELDFGLATSAMQRTFARLLMLEQYFSALRRAVCVGFLQRLPLRRRRSAERHPRRDSVSVWANFDRAGVGASS